MKKIFALVLAVAMLSTTAFAADYDATKAKSGDTTVYGTSSIVTPGKTISIPPSALTKGVSNIITNAVADDFTNANFTVSSRKFKKGGNLVKSVTIDDTDNLLVITLNDDLNLVANTANKTNLVIQELAVKTKASIGKAGGKAGIARGQVYNYSMAPAIAANRAEFTVGYMTKSVSLDDAAYEDGTIATFKGTADTKYAEASLTGADISVFGRVYDGDKIYVSLSNGVEKEILKAYPDAELRFAKLTTSGFTSNNTIQVAAEEDEFVYEIVDKKVVKTNLKWDADSGVWAGKTMGNKHYVISDMELKAIDAPAAPGATNPETGANDVVGIAAALAVISLVAAGAVSLKK